MNVYGGTQTVYTSSYKSEKTECHWGNPLVFTTHDGIEVYAGGSSRGGGWWKMRPLPDFAMGPDGEVKKGYTALTVKTKAKNMDDWSCMTSLHSRKPNAVLEMDFPDYNVPTDCKEGFWEALAVDIREKGIKTIHCMCMGGHGRTGIQLACLRYHLASEEEREAWEDANALISEIRTNYCNKAVEADSQQEYVANMCDLPEGDRLGFHKGGYSYSSPSKKATLTGANRDLLECDRCDLVLWEDRKIVNIEDGDLCYDHGCVGEMQDITDIAIQRHTKEDVEHYQICLTSMDACSDVSGFRLGTLSEEVMEQMHGKDWKKILERLMNNSNKTSVRGVLLRQLNKELKNPTADNVLVVLSDSCTDPLVEDSSRPDYSKKFERGGKKWQKCGFCDTNTSPDRLTVAYVSKEGKEIARRCCPDCMTSSGLELVDRIESLSKNLVDVNDKEYTLVEGLSPMHAYRVRNLRTSHTKESDPKSIKEGLVELGLTDSELEKSIKDYDNQKVDLDYDDFDDYDDGYFGGY